MPRLLHQKPLGPVERRAAKDKRGLPADGSPSAVLIDGRPLVRRRLVRWLQGGSQSFRIISVAAIDELIRDELLAKSVKLIMLSIVGDATKNHAVLEHIDYLMYSDINAPIVLLADQDDLDGIVQVIQHGVRGYILTTSDKDEVAEALRFIAAGGTFVPAVAVVRWMLHRKTETSNHIRTSAFDNLTPREVDVLMYLSEGKPNKIIAYELNISESTVKTFVRRILVKLSANNRTEVAYLVRTQTGALGEDRFRLRNFASRDASMLAGYRDLKTVRANGKQEKGHTRLSR